MSRLAEGIIFAVVRDGHVLVEERPAGDVYAGMFVIPGGAVDAADYAQPDYREACFYRELAEELGIAPVVHEHLATFDCHDPFRTPARTVTLHLYLVTEWAGMIPSHTREGGRAFGKLHWWPLAQSIHLPHPCHRKMARLIRARLRKQPA